MVGEVLSPPVTKEHGPIIARAITVLENTVPKLADYVTVCSKFLRQKAMRGGIHPSKVFIIHNGSNTEDIVPLSRNVARKKLGISSNIIIALLIGQFQTDVFPKLIVNMTGAFKKNRNLRLYIAGTVPPKYENQLRNDNNNIIFLGKVPYDELTAYLTAANVLLLPMEDTAVERARFPIRFGDYIASGTPVLVSPQGEISDILHRNDIAYITDMNKKQIFVSDLERALDDVDKKGKKARLYAEKYLSWNIMARRLDALYAR